MMKKDRVMAIVAVATGRTAVALSMALNCSAFTEQFPGIFGWTVGLLLPLWVLALTLAGKWGSEKPERQVIGIGAYVLAGFLLLVSLPHMVERLALRLFGGHEHRRPGDRPGLGQTGVVGRTRPPATSGMVRPAKKRSLTTSPWSGS